jgi:chromosome segregation ATPase
LKHLLGLPDTVEALHQVEETLSRVDRRIDLLSEAIYRLTEAQARTDQTVQRLSEAQARTDQTVQSLSEAQARTEATLERFMEKTDRGMAELREGMAELRGSIVELRGSIVELRGGIVELRGGMAELRDAQTRTEATLQHFMVSSEKSTAALRREVGALSETIGLDVEAIVSADLPDWLEHHHQLRVQLQCPFVLSELGDEELDGYGEGQGPKGAMTILAEAKNRVRLREVNGFWAKAERVRPFAKGVFFPVLIGRAVYPDAKERAAELGLLVVSTSTLRR